MLELFFDESVHYLEDEQAQKDSLELLEVLTYFYVA